MPVGDLTDLDAVRQSRFTQDSDTGEDAEVRTLITSASRAIARYCGREFSPATDGEAREFEYDGRGPVLVTPYDLRAVTQVRIDTDTTVPQTLLDTEWRLWPNPARDGVYSGVRITRCTWRRRTVVEITGDWGFSSVPTDVEHACIITVATWVGQDKMAFSPLLAAAAEEDMGSRPPAVLLGAIPPGARKLLEPYRRQVFV